MKKLMVMLAAVALAAGAQAAAVSWGSGAFVDHNGTAVTKGASGYKATIHFFAFNTESGEYDINADATFGGTLSTTEVAKGPTMKGDTNTSGIPTGNYMAQLVIVNGDWTLESEKALFAYDADSLSSKPITFSTGDGFTTTGSKFDQSGANHGWQSVPEPTSGLLLLLGVAGLALRRRRA